MYVAFLRGVNVGGRNRIAMADLSSVFEASGARSVRTYIQSGNVIFQAPEREVERVLAAVEDQIEARLGSRIPLTLRSGSELRGIAADHPFRSMAMNPRQLQVGFLRERLPREIVARLDPERSPPDRMLVRGAEIYLLLPNGAARTKLSNAYFDSVLGIPSTFRNWRTVRTLARMTGPEDDTTHRGLD